MKKKSYYLELTTIGDDANSVIKTYRDMTGIGLKQAKDKVESAPCVILETTSMDEAKRYKTALEACGAVITISNSIIGTPSQETQKNVKLKRTYGKWLFIVTGIILCINVLCRVVDAGKSMEYVQVMGTVTMTQTTKEWVRAGNRSVESSSYRVWIEYPIKGYNSLKVISESYSFDMFSKGDKVPVLYQKDATSKAYIAKKDWMTGAYLPVGKWYNVPLIIAAILLAVGFLLHTNSPLSK